MAVQPDGGMNEGEFGFFTRHPGGFDRQFFMQHLLINVTAFADAHSVPLQEVEVLVTLENGEELSVLRSSPALTWTGFYTEDNEVRLVPMTAVRQVKISLRRGEPAAVGFTVRPAEEEEAVVPQGVGPN